MDVVHTKTNTKTKAKTNTKPTPCTPTSSGNWTPSRHHPAFILKTLKLSHCKQCDIFNASAFRGKRWYIYDPFFLLQSNRTETCRSRMYLSWIGFPFLWTREANILKIRIQIFIAPNRRCPFESGFLKIWTTYLKNHFESCVLNIFLRSFSENGRAGRMVEAKVEDKRFLVPPVAHDCLTGSLFESSS